MKRTTITALAFLAIASAHASAVEQGRGEISYATPKISMYNDGHNTFIQSVPGLIIQGATADGDKLIVPGVQREVSGTLGGRPITISQFANDPRPTPAQPAKDSGAALTERLNKLEKELQRKVADYEAQSGMKADAKPAPASVTPPAPEPTWEIRRADGTIFNALNRWAAQAKPQRQIVFDTEGNDFPVVTEPTYTGDFDTVILEVMKGLQTSRYPVRACMWDNKPRPAVKIIHKTKNCES